MSPRVRSGLVGAAIAWGAVGLLVAITAVAQHFPRLSFGLAIALIVTMLGYGVGSAHADHDGEGSRD